MKKLFIIFLFIITIVKTEAYVEYIPGDNSSEIRKITNKCFKPNNLKSHQVQEMIRVESYKNGMFNAYKYREKINQLFLVTDEPFRPQGQIVWEFNGVEKINYSNLFIKYRKTICI